MKKQNILLTKKHIGFPDVFFNYLALNADSIAFTIACAAAF